MQWLVCGIKGGHKCVRMRWLVGGVGRVHEREQGICRLVSIDPGKKSLYELHIQFLVQEKKANFGMVYKWVGLWAGKDVTEQFRHIVHSPNVSLQVLYRLLASMGTNGQATVGVVFNGIQAWESGKEIGISWLLMWLEFAYGPGQKVRDGNIDIEWKLIGGRERHQRPRCIAAEKSDFFSTRLLHVLTSLLCGLGRRLLRQHGKGSRTA